MPHYKIENNQEAEKFLQEHKATSEEVFAILYPKNDGWICLYAGEAAPENTQLYYLSEDDHLKFLDHFKPKIKFNDEEQTIFQEATRLATEEVYAISPEETGQTTASQELPECLTPPATQEELNETAEILAEAQLSQNEFRIAQTEENFARARYSPEAAAEEQNEYVTQSLNRTAMPATAGLQDALWMVQSVALTDGLKNSGTHTATMLASSTKIAGIVFGAAASVVMGVACGLLSAKIYEQKAIQQYKTHHNTEPTGDALKLIKRDAKNFGYSVFGSMTGWTIGAGLMQGVFFAVKAIGGLTPHGLAVYIAISVVAGLGQSIASCVSLYRAEKARCHNPDGTLDQEKWNKLKSSADYKKSMLKTAVASFVAGFAWNMIGSYLPAPVQHAIKHGAQAAKQAASIVATAAASGLSTFLTFCGASIIPTLFHKAKNFFWEKKSPPQNAEAINPTPSRQP